MPTLSTHPSGLQTAEQTLLHIRPHPLFIILRSLGIVTVIIGLTLAARWIAGLFDSPRAAAGAASLAAAIIAIILLWNILTWSLRSYTLTTRRLVRTAGVLRRSTVEIPLDRIQHLQLYRSLRERLFGLGTLGLSTAGTGSVEMIWFMIDSPAQRLADIRAAIRAPSASSGSMIPPSGAGPGSDPSRPRDIIASSSPAPLPLAAAPDATLPVIGLAGGIGSGKSEAARILQSLGCFVIDSDKQARAALDRPDVRDQLTRWWGRGILRPDGTVDRSEVAKIVFADARERTRLEALIHPIVRTRRAHLIAEAIARSAVAAVIDAPLLFEAGVDQECDAVIFIDSPRELRLRRVRESRGWNQAELDRREAAQMPLDEKQARADYVIENAGDREGLARQVEKVLAEVLDGRF